jgi:hypothetical protein
MAASALLYRHTAICTWRCLMVVTYCLSQITAGGNCCRSTGRNSQRPTDGYPHEPQIFAWNRSHVSSQHGPKSISGRKAESRSMAASRRALKQERMLVGLQCLVALTTR